MDLSATGCRGGAVKASRQRGVQCFSRFQTAGLCPCSVVHFLAFAAVAVVAQVAAAVPVVTPAPQEQGSLAPPAEESAQRRCSPWAAAVPGLVQAAMLTALA
mmetsp:Transcript_35822/g.83334  ORF Transcript_35822/g.83334 Transcript_35822/m.83334 type:complete len:102 (-) Transcript_35822:1526-1831(-)